MRNTTGYRSLPYNPALRERANALRKAGNLPEVLLWNRLKRGQFMGLDFDRQKIIGNYIVDFYCAEKMTVVEVDGNSHDNKVDYDTQRDAFLTDLGLQVIHIPVADVKQNLLAVMDMLMQKLFPAPEALDGDARPVEDKTTTTSQGM
ncbi:MAG TPA: endonuclease domain-containing protein [Fibrobacteria bacterium]|nr:endonuclease domain-containing protein [Fibrobacteria bacterium]